MATKRSQTTPGRQLLTLQECSERTGLGLSTIRKWCRLKRLPTIRLSNRVRIDERDLDAWIAQHREESNPKTAL